MRALFGIVSLLVALAVVGVVVMKQLRATGVSGRTGSIDMVQPEAESTASAPAAATVREQSQQIQERVRSDVIKALEEGAARSNEPSP
jgi:hypothetical protein